MRTIGRTSIVVLVVYWDGIGERNVASGVMLVVQKDVSRFEPPPQHHCNSVTADKDGRSVTKDGTSRDDLQLPLAEYCSLFPLSLVCSLLGLLSPLPCHVLVYSADDDI